MSSTTFQRRDFLRATAAIGGGLLVALRFENSAEASDSPNGAVSRDFTANAFVRIAPDGRTTVIINKAEMGQGVCTSLAMLVAEELDADWSKVAYEFAPVDPVYAHPGYGIQMTGGSTSVAGMSLPLRKAGAAARALLVAAAAKQWGVAPSECTTLDGTVLHASSGKKLGYGELAASAVALPIPDDVPLKDPKDFRLVGKSTHRLDTADKVAGKAQFAFDVRLPGMSTALVAHPPVFGAKVKSVDSSAALAVKGVSKVVEIASGVAVIASGFWPAKQARDRLKIEWELGDGAKISSDEMRVEYRKLAKTPGLVARHDGDVDAAFKSAAKTIDAEYELPYLAHSTMEPLNCVVDLKPDSCEIWAGSQFQTLDHAAAVRVCGLAPEKVKLHTTFLGGGFGRRANPASDYIVEAVEIAKHAGAPLQLIWTRTDDLRAGYYRPMWHSRLIGAFDAKGELVGWKHTIVGQSIIAGTPFEPMMVKDGIDQSSVEGAAQIAYSIPNVQVELHTTKIGVPTLWWRSVGHSHTGFAVESFLDELANAAGVDPLEFRRKLLAKDPRRLRVLETAAEAAGWGKKLEAGRARGLAVHHSFESFAAHVAEISIENGKLRIHRFTSAIDCGRVVNPDTITAQLEGAVGFALTAALYSEITLHQGRVEQSNFHDYRMLRIHEMPAVDVHIVASDADSTGVGEPGVPPVAPALCNAIFALTKKRIRRLPIRPEDLKA